MRKILCLVSTFFLIPFICFASIEGPIYDNEGREKYHISAKNEWVVESKLKVTLDYEHYSQRAANTSFLNYHVDGEKYILKITGLGQINIKDLKKTLEYKSNDKKGYISVNNDYSQALDFTDAIAYNTSNDTLTIRAYSFGPEIDKLGKIMSQGSSVSFYISYKNGTKIEIPIPIEVVTEMIEARKYVFNKENKEKLRVEFAKKQEEDKQKKTEILVLLNDKSTVWIESLSPKKLLKLSGTAVGRFDYFGALQDAKNGKNMDVYVSRYTSHKEYMYIIVVPEGELDLNNNFAEGIIHFFKKRNTASIASYYVETNQIPIEEKTILFRLKEVFAK